MAKKKNEESDALSVKTIQKRLDILIRLIIMQNSDDEQFSNTKIIPILNSLGLDPIEIAKIYGKDKASDVSPYLYKKKKGVKSEKSES